MKHLKVEGVPGNLRCLSSYLCTYHVVFRMYVKLCSILLFSVRGKAIVYVVSCLIYGHHVFLYT
jgi:hypothetical protein